MDNAWVLLIEGNCPVFSDGFPVELPSSNSFVLSKTQYVNVCAGMADD